ncbi:hypothetical protein LAZ67_2003211 [Cordylochernes scorpioides]|uniref:RNA-directed DNA polymerase n=1 Tax=Cordylochernes scorpioides TaxID=51811 RepID=A0ABY6K496_9ARAC|nr:hypothetical protein LAZ67_2003211 [Cordylochernes scorpioides]
MVVGQIGFHKDKDVRKMTVEKKINAVVIRLNKTKVKKTPDFQAEREARDQRERESNDATGLSVPQQETTFEEEETSPPQGTSADPLTQIADVLNKLLVARSPREIDKTTTKKKKVMGMKLNLPADILIDSLTEGLPVADQRLIATVQPNIIKEWFDLVSRIRRTQCATSAVYQRQVDKAPHPTYHNPPPRHNNQRSSRVTYQVAPPPSPCKYCYAMHWHSQCEQRFQRDRTSQVYSARPRTTTVPKSGTRPKVQSRSPVPQVQAASRDDSTSPASSSTFTKCKQDLCPTQPRKTDIFTTFPSNQSCLHVADPTPIICSPTIVSPTISPTHDIEISIPSNATPQLEHCPHELHRILYEFSHVFSTNKYNVPKLNIPPVKINTTTDKIIALRPYRVPLHDQQEIQTQIEQMLQHGIIAPSVSPYASPITLVTKRDKTKRFCIDYRKLNEIIAPDVHPLPLIETILDKLSKAKYYSAVDIASAYWQVEVEPNSRNLLAFVTLGSQYEFCRLPYGFKNSPQIYHRAINQVMQKYKLNFVTHYFNIFIIFSDTLEENLQHLQQFLTVCQHENIKLNYNKCSFFKTNIDFLGYTVTAGTYAPQTRNLDTISAIKPPTNRKTLQSFLGAVNVYNKFIPDYARLRAPLNKLLKKDVKWNWDPDCQQAFTTLKESLTSKPVLHLYQVGLPCRLYCDASTQGIAGILKQVHPDGQVHPVQYFSRALRAHERNYTVSELECLAIVESVDKFRIYLTGFVSADIIKQHQPTASPFNIDTNGLHTITRKGVIKIIIPETLQHTLMNKVHQEYNHPGISQMTRIITAQYYWKGISKSIEKFVKSCHTCQIIKRPKGKPYGALGQIPPPQQPFDLISIDTIAGFSKYGHSKTYLHVIVDHLTRYAWTFPSKSTSTLTYIQTLKTVLQQGSPKRLLSDRAPAFTSEKFRKFLITHGIQPLLTTSNNPQANGLIERLNATITGKLRLAYLENPKASWTQLVKRVTQTYNNTPHSVTSFPPTYLMFNIIPPDLRTHLDPYPEINISREIANSRTQNKHKKDKEIFDKQHRTPHFEVNDLVLVKNYRHPDTGKLAPYFTGPYKIIEIISPNVVRIDRPNQPLNRDSDTIHVNKLKYYTENVLYITPPQTRFAQNPQRLSQDIYFSEFNHLTPDIFETQLVRIIPPTSSQPFLHLNPNLSVQLKQRSSIVLPKQQSLKMKAINQVDLQFPQTRPPTLSHVVECRDPSHTWTVEDILTDLDPAPLNNGENTYLSKSTSTESAIDITAINYNIAPTTQWKILKSAISDHRPILTTLNFKIENVQQNKRTWNFRKTDCKKFTEKFEEVCNEELNYRTLDKNLEYSSLRTYPKLQKHRYLEVDVKTYFLRGRKIKDRVNGAFSKDRRTWAGVPQGSVLTSLLFLLYINDIHPYLTEDTKVAGYADDIAIWHTTTLLDGGRTAHSALKLPLNMQLGMKGMIKQWSATAIVFKQLEHLITCDTAQKQWTGLKSIYEQRSTTSLLAIQQQFYSYKMNEKDAMSKHISKIEGLIKQFCELGEKVSEAAFMAKVLGSLPSKYAHFLTAWDSVTQTEQTKENLIARLLQEEIRLDQKDQQDDATAFKATANYNWKKNKTCNYCKRPGHFWAECRNRLRDQKQKNKNSLQPENRDMNRSRKHEDSGRSAFICENEVLSSIKDEFNELDEEYQVKLGDNHVINASGKGTILISCYVDGEWTKGILKNVLYVPEIHKNLFSAGAATNLGNKIITEKEICNIFMNDKKVACGTKGSNNLYTMLFKVTHEAEANTANAYSLTWWHRRLGHINVDTIRMMAKNGQFSDLKLREEKDFFCEA